MIEKHSFALTWMEPRLTKEKIEFIAKVDRGEKFAPAFTDAELIRRVENEITCLKYMEPDNVDVHRPRASSPAPCARAACPPRRHC